MEAEVIVVGHFEAGVVQQRDRRLEQPGTRREVRIRLAGAT